MGVADAVEYKIMDKQHKPLLCSQGKETIILANT